MATTSGCLFRISVVLLSCLACGCVAAGPKPYKEYTIARVAIESARSSGAPTMSPGYWHRADEHYRKASSLFDANENLKAKKEFKKAIRFAEKAENATRLKRFQTGEGFP